MARSWTLAAAGVLAIAGWTHVTHGQTFHVVGLGDLGGMGDTEAFGLQTVNGQTRVVGFATSAGQNHRAFTWNDGVTTAIAPLAGDAQSVAFGIDGQGAVYGVSYTLGSPTLRAFRSFAGVTASLGAFTPRGVNPTGDIVGSLPVVDGEGLQAEHACVLPNGWSTPIDLGTLFGSAWSKAFAINAQQWIVGCTGGPTPIESRAALWLGGMKIDLGTLGGAHSGAYAINDAQLVVGWSETVTQEKRATRFLLSGAGLVLSRQDMGVLPPSVPGSGSWSYAYGVNNRGQVVGQSNGRAFIDYGQGLRDINQLTTLGEGWFIVSARAIDEQGQIAAWGVDAIGTPRAVLLKPCDADFDRGGSVDVQDIFAMLNAWFAGDIRADVSRDGLLTIQDVFEFLNQWFVSC